MRPAAVREAARRAVTLLLVTTGGVLGFRYGVTATVVLLVIALMAYVLIPREAPPAGALLPDRMAAIIGPDLLGVLLGSVFLGMPFAAAVFEGEPLATIHPSAVLAWPMAVFAIVILAVATRYAVWWVVIEPDGLRIADIRDERHIRYEAIARVEPYRRGLPKAVRWLTPLLILTGRYTEAGAVVLARDTTGIRLVGKDGARLAILVAEGFEQPLRRISRALEKHGVPFASP